MRDANHGRPTIGVLAGTRIYYGTILGNFTGPVVHGIYSAALEHRCNLMPACGMEYTLPRPSWPVSSPEASIGNLVLLFSPPPRNGNAEGGDSYRVFALVARIAGGMEHPAQQTIPLEIFPGSKRFSGDRFFRREEKSNRRNTK
jgi:hypothetical protein